MFSALGFSHNPQLLFELLSTCMEAYGRNYIFLNNHRVGEDYETYWHLCKTDLKIINEFVILGSLTFLTGGQKTNT